MTTLRSICICSGNICRSPMALALLREKYRQRQIPAVVISAGTLNIQGRRAADFARSAITEVGPEVAEHIEEHRSQGISPSLLGVADHLIIMSPRHEAALLQMNPRIADRIVRLWEWAPPEYGPLHKIDDPVGKGPEVFRACRDLIDQCLDRWLDDLQGAS